MLFSRTSISDLLINSQQMINIVDSDEELKKALAPYNYSEETLKQGGEVFRESDRLTHEYSEAAGKESAASDEFKKARKRAHNQFMEHLNLTRLALRKEPEKLAEFKIPDRMARKVNAHLFQMVHFYQTVLANDELLRKLSKYGVTKEKLLEGQQFIEEAGSAREKYKKQKGRVQDLKIRRDKALEELDDWVTELAVICRYALKERPQMLEKMGIQILSKGYRRQKGGNKEVETAA